ncbi:MAG TPA: hypothetical protein VMR45_05260 [Patescibacteria group bacterium]|nr:hypothetical protein [Patescibacteria group bacterium]
MAGIGDVGGSIEEAFGPKADELGAAISEVEGLARAIQAQFESAISGSESVHVRTLREQLGTVIIGLGSAATALQATRPTSQELLATWGIGGTTAAGGSPPEATGTAQPGSREALSPIDKRTWLDANSQSLLSAGLRHINTTADNKTGRVVTYALQRGVETVRDAIVIGAERLQDARGIGRDLVGVLRDTLSQHFPDVELPARSDPVIAARICPSLGDVPFQALEGNGTITARGPGRITVQDLLDKPAAELFIGEYAYTKYGEKLTERDMDNFNRLRRRAQEYAAIFDQAKRELGLTQP